MDPLGILLLLIIGLGVGIIAAMLGIGGGILYVPILVLGFHVDAFEATAISSFVIIFTSSSSAYQYWRQRRIDLTAAGTMIAMAIPGSIIGASIVTFIAATRDYLKATFGFLLIALALRDLVRIYKKRNEAKTNSDFGFSEEEEANNPNAVRLIDKQGVIFRYERNLKAGAAFGFLGGLIAGILGMGGGVIYVPAFSLAMGLPMHLATAASSSVVIFSSIVAVIIKSKALTISILITYGLPLAAGAVIGANIGARSARKVQSAHLKLAFSILLMIVGVRLIIS